ncbi:hypothetical protein BDW22DRAFT_1348593 [Trametopsis cervina]|nr:hypothetical protein BDW22DRAFT_1348593 [Trametopsis cervina]
MMPPIPAPLRIRSRPLTLTLFVVSAVREAHEVTRVKQGILVNADYDYEKPESDLGSARRRKGANVMLYTVCCVLYTVQRKEGNLVLELNPTPYVFVALLVRRVRARTRSVCQSNVYSTAHTPNRNRRTTIMLPYATKHRSGPLGCFLLASWIRIIAPPLSQPLPRMVLAFWIIEIRAAPAPNGGFLDFGFWIPGLLERPSRTLGPRGDNQAASAPGWVLGYLASWNGPSASRPLAASQTSRFEPSSFDASEQGPSDACPLGDTIPLWAQWEHWGRDEFAAIVAVLVGEKNH